MRAKKPGKAALSSPISGDSGATVPEYLRYKFAFIIPAYAGKENAKAERDAVGIISLGRCIDSIFNQTDPSCRIIIVNDGASLKMRELVQTFQSIRSDIPITYMQAPYRGKRGGHESINMALSVLPGDVDFVTFLNADNTLRPTYIEDMYNPDCDILTCMVKMNDIPGTVLSGLSFTRGFVDRLNYSVRADIARKIKHKMHIDADCDYIIDSAMIAENGFHHVEKILGEHN